MNEELKKETMTIPDRVSVYEINGTTYKVRTHFNLDCKETLSDIVGRLIIQEIDEMECDQV